MKKITLILLLSLLYLTPAARAQYITSRGNYLEGTSYISTSRIEAFHTRNHYASTATLSMDFVHMNGTGHTLKSGDYYTIQMNFFERNVGQSILLKCKNGKVIELNSNSIQRDPFVRIFWTDEKTIKQIIDGEIIKIRILDSNCFVDREIKGNTFSKAVGKCYNLIKSTQKKNECCNKLKSAF
mgnify:CR=1 FL=1